MPQSRDLFEQLKLLTTEARNPRTREIDLASTTRILEMINDEDRTVADAVRASLGPIARAVDLVAAKLGSGGRLFYIGAGTSGRLGVIDAAECPPTFGTDPEQVQGLIAGGRDTVFLSKEGVEDHGEWGERDINTAGVSASDAVVGITASRRTPYVLSALARSRALGAATVLLRCNDGPEPDVDVVITAVPGPEAITGSTRMKAGTTQKMVLNMISTASMVKLGKVYENLMVDLRPNSDKLIERARGIVMLLTGTSYEDACATYDASGRNVKVAVVMQKLGLDEAAAQKRLTEADGFLARALGER